MASIGVPDPFGPLVSPGSPVQSTGKKSWSELQRCVKNTRKLNSALCNRVLTGFTFRHLHSNLGRITRLYFLGVPYSGVLSSSNTLVYVDLPYVTGTEYVPPDPEWHQLLESFRTTVSQSQLSKEEQLLRERKRLGSFGITSYDVDAESGMFVFPSCNSLFMCADSLCGDSFMDLPLFPTEIQTSIIGSRLDVKLCPCNPDLVAYVSTNDLWVANTHTGHEKRLTFAHRGKERMTDNPNSAGVPSFVIQEEFDRYSGYWWQPVVTQSSNCSGRVYRILYEEVNESDVIVLNIVSPSCKGVEVEEHRYPRPGQNNAKSCLKLMQFRLDANGDFKDIEDFQLSETLCNLYPDMEYLVRAGWTPNGNYVWAQILNRLQTKLQLLLIPLEDFSHRCVSGGSNDNGGLVVDMNSLTSEEDEEMTSLNCGLVAGSIRVLYEDVSDIWVNVHDNLQFLPQTQDSEISFIWSSEKSGYRHLYLCKANVHQTSVIQNADIDTSVSIEEIQLTSGDWVVLPKEVWVDCTRKLVYFLGMKDTPLETHLYVVSYDNPGDVVRLTELGSSHTVYMDKVCSMFVSVHSNLQHPNTTQVFLLHCSSEGQVSSTLHCTLSRPAERVEGYHPPEMFTYTSESHSTQMHGMVFKPHKLEAGQVYPTMLFVYGGPQVQIVSNAFKGLRYLRLHTMASLGYVVVAIDSRGSCNRGLAFESVLKDRLGHIELLDQVEGLRWLASQVDYIDLSRVAIHGSSYGGYLSLMALVQHPDFFKVAIAGSPVTCWNLYDTGYTERYLKLPASNMAAYSCSSMLDMARLFPSELMGTSGVELTDWNLHLVRTSPGGDFSYTRRIVKILHETNFIHRAHQEEWTFRQMVNKTFFRTNRLLIIHGLMDENVHFHHTSSLIDALIKAGKPYQLQVYPNERHGIRSAECSEHYETVVLNFLAQNL